MYLFYVFFFKQKTAYEMRISDWSSDVCSSDLFSNDFGSNATSNGAYLTGDYYTGKHGRSMRLQGMDPTNCHAEARAIVVHGAWYVGPEMIREHGKLGRSEGCFAFAESDRKSTRLNSSH